MCPLVEDATGNDLTYRIIGAAMTVHNSIGSGYKEEIYEKALELELNRCGLACVRQFPVTVRYLEESVGQFYLDLWVENRVVVELKAFSHQITGDEIAQVINYLIAASSPVGLLFNFGRRKLEHRRVFPPKFAPEAQPRVGRDDVLKAGRETKEGPRL